VSSYLFQSNDGSMQGVAMWAATKRHPGHLSCQGAEAPGGFILPFSMKACPQLRTEKETLNSPISQCSVRALPYGPTEKLELQEKKKEEVDF